jgi:hypothetical protein
MPLWCPRVLSRLERQERVNEEGEACYGAKPCHRRATDVSCCEQIVRLPARQVQHTKAAWYDMYDAQSACIGAPYRQTVVSVDVNLSTRSDVLSVVKHRILLCSVCVPMMCCCRCRCMVLAQALRP